MNFGKTPENLDNQEKIRLNQLADKLDELQKTFAKQDDGIIPYVNWIVQDLRKGDLATAKVNYEQQRDKYDDKPEIKKFLEDNGIADKGIDWDAWKNSDTYEEYQDHKNEL
jgi:hypothetical protein